MGFKIADILGGSLLSGVNDILGKFIPDKGEQEKARKELTETLLNASANYESELTKRLQSDNSTDSKLTKNLRPILTLSFFGLFTLSVILNYFKIKVDSEYLIILKEVMLTAVMFYFGGRSIEKVTNLVQTNKK